MPLPRSQAEIIGQQKDDVLTAMRKCIPATVTAVHPDRMTVDVQIAVTTPHTDPIGQVSFEDAAAVCDVPLGTMRGGKFFVWLPVSVGDSVLLLSSDLSTDTWRASQQTATGPKPTDPFFVGKHTLDSCFAIPMFAPDAYIFSDPAGDPGKIIIGRDGGPEIKISTSDIELGGTSDAVALASKVATELGKVASAISALSSAVALATTTTPGNPIGFSPPSPYSPSPVASTTVKAV